MQHSAPLEYQWDLALWSLLNFGVLVGACVVFLVVLRRPSESVQSFAKLSAVIVAVFFAMLVVTKFSMPTPHVPTAFFVPVDPDPPLSPLGGSLMPMVDSESSESSLRVATAEAEPAPPTAELPEWTRKTSQVDGAKTFVVVKSGRFATLEEAELHAFDEAGQAAARHYRQFDPSGVGQCAQVQRELVRQQAIRERFEEISRHDFGVMKDYPMHQVWLRVELSPQLGERFAEPWRQAAVAIRLRMLTGWSVWGTAAAALIAFALRLDSAWNGRRRAVVVGTTAAIMLGSLMFVA